MVYRYTLGVGQHCSELKTLMVWRGSVKSGPPTRLADSNTNSYEPIADHSLGVQNFGVADTGSWDDGGGADVGGGDLDS